MASAGSRSAVVADAERSARVADVSPGTALTIHRLLQTRLGWTRHLVRTLGFLDLPPAAPAIGTNTIIDEPDPAGYGDQSENESNDSEDETPPSDVDEDPSNGSVQFG
jgi:hypothetical protein